MYGSQALDVGFDAENLTLPLNLTSLALERLLSALMRNCFFFQGNKDYYLISLNQTVFTVAESFRTL